MNNYPHGIKSIKSDDDIIHEIWRDSTDEYGVLAKRHGYTLNELLDVPELEKDVLEIAKHQHALINKVLRSKTWYEIKAIAEYVNEQTSVDFKSCEYNPYFDDYDWVFCNRNTFYPVTTSGDLDDDSLKFALTSVIRSLLNEKD